MNKEEILKLSQQEGKGRSDEREISLSHKASTVAILVGGIVCVALTAVESLLLETTNISIVAFLIYSYMTFTERFYLFRKLKNRINLVWSIITFVAALAFTVTFVIKIINKEFV